MITAGDMQLLPKILDAGNQFKNRPSEKEIEAIVEEFDMKKIF